MNQLRSLSVLLTMSLSLAACSTTSFSIESHLTVPATVRAPVRVHRAVREYLPELVEMLQSVGFSVGRTNDPEALELQLNYNPNPFNLRVSASLLQDGVPVVRAASTNTGWGTIMFRGNAIDGRAEAMLSAFANELEDLVQRITIRPDVSAITSTE
jgi:hypothetical protein